MTTFNLFPSLNVITQDDMRLNDILHDIENISEEKLYDYIYKNHVYIIKELFQNKNKDVYPILSYPKFINALIQVARNVNLQEDEKIYLNDYIYNNIVFGNPTPFWRTLLMMAGEVINSQTDIMLKGLNCLDNELSTFLSITSLSTFRTDANIKRVNFTLCTSSTQVLSVQNIINIYRVIYPTRFSELFLVTMFDRNISDAEEAGEEWVTDTVSAINDNISIALVWLLESFEPTYINSMLRILYDKYQKEYNSCPESMRTSLRVMTSDSNYFKIPYTLSIMDGEDKIIP